MSVGTVSVGTVSGQGGVDQRGVNLRRPVVLILIKQKRLVDERWLRVEWLLLAGRQLVTARGLGVVGWTLIREVWEVEFRLGCQLLSQLLVAEERCRLDWRRCN